METKIEQLNGQAQVAFSGPLTLEYASEMKEILHNALKNADRVNLDFRQAAEVDLSCLQTLCSAHRTAEGMGKRFAINANFSASFLETVEKAGYVRHTGCVMDRTKTCLWVEQYRENRL